MTPAEIESGYDRWIAQLMSKDYTAGRKAAVEKREKKKFANRLSEEFKVHMARSGCPTQALLLSKQRLREANMSKDKKKGAALRKDYVAYSELAIANGSMGSFELFAHELELGKAPLAKDEARANRLKFFKSLEERKGPFDRSPMFTFEAFKKSGDEGVRAKRGGGQSDSDDSYYENSDDEREEESGSESYSESYSESDDDDYGGRGRKAPRSYSDARPIKKKAKTVAMKKKRMNSFCEKKTKNSKKKK